MTTKERIRKIAEEYFHVRHVEAMRTPDQMLKELATHFFSNEIENNDSRIVRYCIIELNATGLIPANLPKDLVTVGPIFA